MDYFDPVYIQGLSPEFYENNGTKLLTDVANWADLCTEVREQPVYHPESGIDNQIHPADNQSPNPDEHVSGADNRPPNLPMNPPLTIDHFFYAARALSGPNLEGFAAVGAAHDLLGKGLVNVTINLTNQPGDPNDPRSPARQAGTGQDGLINAMHLLFENWEGPAAKACADYSAKVAEFMTAHQKVIANSADLILAYCAIVRGARRKLIGLMGGFVDAMLKTEAEDTESARQFQWNALALAVGAIATGGFGLAPVVTAEVVEASAVISAVAQPLLGVAGNVADKVLNGDKDNPPATNGIPVGDYADAAAAYLRATDDVLNDAREAILRVTQAYNDVNDMYMQMPPSPIKPGPDDKDHKIEPRKG